MVYQEAERVRRPAEVCWRSWRLEVSPSATRFSTVSGRCARDLLRVKRSTDGVPQTERSADNSVDGGHRAIKYSRLHGVRPDIYPEGTHLIVCAGRMARAADRLHPAAVV